MIWDQLCELCPRLRTLADAHIVLVPFRVCPREPDEGNPGHYCFNWRSDDIPAGLMPRVGPEKLLSAEWAHPPYEEVVIASERDEDGAILVIAEPPPTDIAARCDLEGKRIEWYAEAAMWFRREDGSVLCGGLVPIVAFRNEEGGVGVALPNPLYCMEGAVRLSAWLHGGDRQAWDEVRRLTGESTLRADGALHAKGIIATTVTTFSLLNCKNVMEEQRLAPRQERRRRERAGVPPLFQWHVLSVTPPAARGRRGPAGRGQPLALHWTRGHFKDYRTGSGLFGKVQGLFWWSPHLAGTADRFVGKDYRLRPEQTEEA